MEQQYMLLFAGIVVGIPAVFALVRLTYREKK